MLSKKYNSKSSKKESFNPFTNKFILFSFKWVFCLFFSKMARHEMGFNGPRATYSALPVNYCKDKGKHRILFMTNNKRLHNNLKAIYFLI